MKLFRLIHISMKFVRYIRPTSRRTEQAQRDATQRAGISTTIVDDWPALEKQLRKGRRVLVDNLYAFGRRRADIAERVGFILRKGGFVHEADGTIHAPDHADAIVSAIMLPERCKHVSRRPRVAHNKTPDEKREEARKLWEETDMTAGKIASLVGVSTVSLYRWFGKRDRPVGRPRGT